MLSVPGCVVGGVGRRLDKGLSASAARLGFVLVVGGG